MQSSPVGHLVSKELPVDCLPGRRSPDHAQAGAGRADLVQQELGGSAGT